MAAIAALDDAALEVLEVGTEAEEPAVLTEAAVGAEKEAGTAVQQKRGIGAYGQ